MQLVNDIRENFLQKFKEKQFVTDRTGVKTIELIGESFIADEPSIFGTVNKDWCERELSWYLSQSLDVNDIIEPIPKIWKKVASLDGKINSNYGWCIFSEENGSQYFNAFDELWSNPDSRRAQMIYTRPSMHVDWNKNGMSDFMCCSNTVHFIRDNELITFVNFRSNDAIFGYKGDYFWMNFVHTKLYFDLLDKYTNLRKGDIVWSAASLHVYEQHFHLLEKYMIEK